MKNQYMEQLIAEYKAKCQEKLAQYAQNPDRNIQEALATKNINLLRSIIRLELNNTDISFEQLMTKTLFLAEQDVTVFVPFEVSKFHSDFEIDKQYWTEEYFLTQRSYLAVNFSLERMVHLIDVKRYLQPDVTENTPLADKVAVANLLNHSIKGMSQRIDAEFEQFKRNPLQWFKDNPVKTVGILVVLAILAWCIL